MRTKLIVVAALAVAVGIVGVGIATAGSTERVAVTDCLAESGVQAADLDALRDAVDACAAPLREELGDAAECIVERRPNLLDLDALRAVAEECGLAEDDLRERFELERDALGERLEGFSDCLAREGIVVPTQASDIGSALLSLIGLDEAELKAAYETCRDELPLAPSLGG